MLLLGRRFEVRDDVDVGVGSWFLSRKYVRNTGLGTNWRQLMGHLAFVDRVDIELKDIDEGDNI